MASFGRSSKTSSLVAVVDAAPYGAAMSEEQQHQQQQEYHQQQEQQQQEIQQQQQQHQAGNDGNADNDMDDDIDSVNFDVVIHDMHPDMHPDELDDDDDDDDDSNDFSPDAVSDEDNADRTGSCGGGCSDALVDLSSSRGASASAPSSGDGSDSDFDDESGSYSSSRGRLGHSPARGSDGDGGLRGCDIFHTALPQQHHHHHQHHHQYQQRQQHHHHHYQPGGATAHLSVPPGFAALMSSNPLQSNPLQQQGDSQQRQQFGGGDVRGFSLFQSASPHEKQNEHQQQRAMSPASAELRDQLAKQFRAKKDQRALKYLVRFIKQFNTGARVPTGDNAVQVIMSQSRAKLVNMFTVISGIFGADAVVRGGNGKTGEPAWFELRLPRDAVLRAARACSVVYETFQEQRKTLKMTKKQKRAAKNAAKKGKKPKGKRNQQKQQRNNQNNQKQNQQQLMEQAQQLAVRTMAASVLHQMTTGNAWPGGAGGVFDANGYFSNGVAAYNFGTSHSYSGSEAGSPTVAGGGAASSSAGLLPTPGDAAIPSAAAAAVPSPHKSTSPSSSPPLLGVAPVAAMAGVIRQRSEEAPTADGRALCWASPTSNPLAVPPPMLVVNGVVVPRNDFQPQLCICAPPPLVAIRREM